MPDNLREPSQPAAIMATYADWRPVKGRKVLQLTFEVPLEQQAEVLTMLGAPMPDQQRWCAIALMDTASRAAPAERPPEVHVPDGEPSGLGGASGGPSLRRSWSSLPVSQRAAIRCQDERFQSFVAEKAGLDDCDARAADYWLKRRLGIASKRELATDGEAAQAFERIDTDYMIWAGLIPAPR